MVLRFRLLLNPGITDLNYADHVAVLIGDFDAGREPFSLGVRKKLPRNGSGLGKCSGRFRQHLGNGVKLPPSLRTWKKKRGTARPPTSPFKVESGGSAGNFPFSGRRMLGFGSRIPNLDSLSAFEN
jgi:hypothetical protein